jgi:signal transduction histidine kinase
MEDPQMLLLRLLDEQIERVAYELHDSLGSHLTGVAMIARDLEVRLAQTPALAQDAQWISHLVHESIEITRRISRGLQPVPDAPGALWRALEQLCADTDRIHGVCCVLQTQGDVDHIAPAAANHVYRIVQETLVNAMRHAQPRLTSVTLGMACETWHLVVENDGGPVDEATPSERRGVGLASISARAAALGATLSLSPRAGGGLRVALRWRQSPVAP